MMVASGQDEDSEGQQALDRFRIVEEGNSQALSGTRLEQINAQKSIIEYETVTNLRRRGWPNDTQLLFFANQSNLSNFVALEPPTKAPNKQRGVSPTSANLPSVSARMLTHDLYRVSLPNLQSW